MVGRSDYVFDGEFAERWIDIIGDFGDPIRSTIVNPIAAHVAHHFAEKPLQLNLPIEPQNIIQQALEKVRDELAKVAYPSTKDFRPLKEWHENSSQLESQYPGLKKAFIWDLGCGEGYLGRWLQTIGAKYHGIEPGEKLFKHAIKKAKQKSEIQQMTIEGFLRTQPVKLGKPTTINLIAVLDGCGNAPKMLETINRFLTDAEWFDIPLFITTFDPDFFCPQLPAAPENQARFRFLGNDQDFIVRDPAEWERIFSKCGFHILDQRPLHLNLLPKALLKYVLDIHRAHFEHSDDFLARISPRQGPFYFWIISPRQRRYGRKQRNNVERQQIAGKFLDADSWSFAPTESIELLGNLGSRIYEVLEGAVHHTISDRFDLDFDKGQFFGQLELSQNYFSSRILGPIFAKEKTVLRVFDIGEVAEQVRRGDFGNNLFLSMIRHLDSIGFSPFVNAKRVSGEQHSHAIQVASKTRVRNCAAVILNKCANRCITGSGVYKSPSAGITSEIYKSRILIRLPFGDIEKYIFHQKKGRADQDLMDVIGGFVQHSIVDCFSAKLLRDIDLQDDIKGNVDEDLENGDFLHLGLIAAIYLKKSLGDYAAEFDLESFAIAISGYLGDERDKKNYLEYLRDESDREREDSKKHLTKPRNISQIRASIVKDLIDHLGKLPDDLVNNITIFLDRLHSEFNFQDKERYQGKGFSYLMVVRDVWALLACVLDDEKIWTTDKDIEPAKKYAKRPEERHRLRAYFYECIGHIAKECGLSV